MTPVSREPSSPDSPAVRSRPSERSRPGRFPTDPRLSTEFGRCSRSAGALPPRIRSKTTTAAPAGGCAQRKGILVDMRSLRPDTLESDLAVVRFTQSAAEFNEQVATYTARRFDELRSGRRKPISTRRIDVNPHSGAYTSRVSRRGAAYSQPRVVAVSRRRISHVAVGCPMPRPRDARRSRRAVARARPTRSRAPSGSSDGSQGDSGGADGPGSQFARGNSRYGVVRFADVSAEGVTPAAFNAAIDRRLGPGVPGGVKWRIFMALGDETQARFWSAVRAQADAEHRRWDNQPESPRVAA